MVAPRVEPEHASGRLWTLASGAANFFKAKAKAWGGGWVAAKTAYLVVAFWKLIHPIVAITRYTRVATLSVILGGAGLLFTDQGRELGLVIAARQDGGSFILSLAWLVVLELAIIFWAIVFGVWARRAIEASPSDRSKRHQAEQEWQLLFQKEYAHQHVASWLIRFWPAVLAIAAC